MRYKVIAADPLYGRLLTLELERLGFTESGAEDFELLAVEGQTELPHSRRLCAVVLVDCGLLAASLPETVKVLILDRPFSLTELRDFCAELEPDASLAPDGDGISLYPDELSVSFGELNAKLTKREYALFEYLHSRQGEVITRSELLHELWRDENARDTNVVDVYIRFLRAKLDERFGVKLIRAKRGEGYTYSPDIRKENINEIRPAN